MPEEDATEKPHDQTATEFKVSEDMPQEKVAAAEESAPALAPVAVAEEARAPVEPRQEVVEQKTMAEVPVPAIVTEEFGSYKVSKDETLMMVAFKIYGDYQKWKELKAWNKEQLKHGIHAGMSLKYTVPEKKFVWEPSGLPYLVKSGNTLSTISKDKYGTSSKWKDLYENNRPLIKNPNEIYVGFTIYYIPARGIASKKK
jgi:nucleoid-associated protein YgaU